MNITFFSNFMSHHQEGISNQLFESADVNYHLVACSPIAQQRINLGFEDMNKKYDYIIRPYEDHSQLEHARKLACESDVVIFGSCDKEFFDIRMQTDKLSFIYCERLLKKGTYRRFIPVTYKKIYDGYVKYKHKPLYILCASAYTSYDLSLCGFPSEKCYKWGYFPPIKNHDIDVLLSKKAHNEILWAGRFIDWKHPEVAVCLAEKLKNDRIPFHLTMVGDGVEMSHIKNMIAKRKLQDVITLTGSLPPNAVREYMEKSPIFLSTSNFQEGWGAVLNEAMNSGCACVASHAVGAAPYLINKGQNGLIYKNGSIKDLVNKIKLLLSDSKTCENMGYKAYQTTQTHWNETVAAKRLIELSNSLSGSGEANFIEGICSNAEVLKNNWY